jgi:CRP-like cAMP-binding protein
VGTDAAAGTGEQEQKREILNRSELFTSLRAALLDEIAEKATFVRVSRRGTLPQDHSPMLVLGRGRVRVVRPARGRDITLDYLGPGDVVGENALVSEQEPARVVALERVEALRLPLAYVRGLMARESVLATRLMYIVGRRRARAEHRLESILTRPVESRVAEFLLWCVERYGVPDPRGILIGVKFTHQEIADYVGSTRETATLVLGELKRSGAIDTDHRRIVVLDGEGLRKRV